MLIKNMRQTVVINIFKYLAFFIQLDVLHARQYTFSELTVKILQQLFIFKMGVWNLD